MSGTRTKKLKQAFEMKYGFTAMDCKNEIYRREWKRFKRNTMGMRRG